MPSLMNTALRSLQIQSFTLANNVKLRSSNYQRDKHASMSRIEVFVSPSNWRPRPHVKLWARQNLSVFNDNGLGAPQSGN
jgi:hypothetical protein